MRVLFVNEGVLGRGVLGHSAAAAAVAAGLGPVDDLDLRLVGLPPMGRLHRAAVSRVTGLDRLDLDWQPARWHAVQARRTRRLVEEQLAVRPADALVVNSHSIGMGLPDGMPPIVPLVDVSILEWQRLGVWRPARPHTPVTLRRSLRAERRLFERSAAVVALTEWSAAGVRRASPAARVEVLHPGIDLARFRPAAGAAPDRPSVVFVGGRFEEKGGGDLLEALGPLAGQELDLHLVTQADVPADEGVHVHRLAPGSDELLELYRGAAAVCLPTHADAVPWSVLEAMACGVPVVATEVGAIPELLDGGRAGVLVPSRRPDELRRAVIALLADPARRQTLGNRARERCEERYDARRQGARLADLLRSVVD